MEHVNDSFPISDIKHTLVLFSKDIHDYILGALRIFSVQEYELSASEVQFVAYLKDIDVNVQRLVKEQLSFLDIMEVESYNLKELYLMLDNLKITYENMLDKMLEDFLQSIASVEELQMVKDMSLINNNALKTKFMANAAEIIFSNVSELNDRIKKLLGND